MCTMLNTRIRYVGVQVGGIADHDLNVPPISTTLLKAEDARSAEFFKSVSEAVA